MNIRPQPLRPARTENPVVAFFMSRWRRDIPLDRLFWHDMVFVGTAISLVSTFVALMMLGFKAPTPLAIAVHFAPLPYSLFLFLAVWRTAERAALATAWTAQAGAALWLVMATIV